MASNDQLAEAVRLHGEQLGQLSTMLNSALEAQTMQAQALLAMQQQLLGYAGAFQVFGELVMVASPSVQQTVATSLAQVLARPDAAQNETMRNVLSALHAASTSPPRTSPEGRRANFQVIPGGEGSEP